MPGASEFLKRLTALLTAPGKYGFHLEAEEIKSAPGIAACFVFAAAISDALSSKSPDCQRRSIAIKRIRHIR
jgi:hypothetical protein